jgi:hypothetical protein
MSIFADPLQFKPAGCVGTDIEAGEEKGLAGPYLLRHFSQINLPSSL